MLFHVGFCSGGVLRSVLFCSSANMIEIRNRLYKSGCQMSVVVDGAGEHPGAQEMCDVSVQFHLILSLCQFLDSCCHLRRLSCDSWAVINAGGLPWPNNYIAFVLRKFSLALVIGYLQYHPLSGVWKASGKPIQHILRDQFQGINEILGISICSRYHTVSIATKIQAGVSSVSLPIFKR